LLPFWLGREYRLWEEIVPEDVRKLTIEKGLVKTYAEELAYAKSQVAT
jgi:hypothetical protein